MLSHFFLTVCYRTPAASGLTQEAFMESVITVLIFLAVISLSIYLTYYSTDSSGSNKFNNILTFCMPFFSTMVIGISVINKFIYLPIVITVALIAGVLSLLVSWSAEKKSIIICKYLFLRYN